MELNYNAMAPVSEIPYTLWRDLYLRVGDILQWVDEFCDHGPQEDDEHHQRSDKLPHGSPEPDHSRRDPSGGNLVKETG